MIKPHIFLTQGHICIYNILLHFLFFSAFFLLSFKLKELPLDTDLLIAIVKIKREVPLLRQLDIGHQWCEMPDRLGY
jgi:hypothetical protein